MDPNLLNKTFYAPDPRLPKDVPSLPPGTTCKLCQCLVTAHLVYWHCPLLDGFICSNCCQEEVPDPSNLGEIQKKCPNISSCAQITEVCKACNRNSLG